MVMLDVTYEWDEDKRLSNLAKHGFDFKDAARIFEGQHVASASAGYGEDRWQATGSLNGLEATVVFTMRGDVIRIISIRRARRNERRNYYQDDPRGST